MEEVFVSKCTIVANILFSQHQSDLMRRDFLAFSKYRVHSIEQNQRTKYNKSKINFILVRYFALLYLEEHIYETNLSVL